MHLHQSDVWPETSIAGHPLGPAGRLRHEVHVWLGSEYRSEALAKDRVTLNAKDTDLVLFLRRECRTPGFTGMDRHRMIGCLLGQQGFSSESGNLRRANREEHVRCFENEPRHSSGQCNGGQLPLKRQSNQCKTTAIYNLGQSADLPRHLVRRPRRTGVANVHENRPGNSCPTRSVRG